MKKKHDPLSQLLAEIEKLIKTEFGTLEQFAYQTGAIEKSTLNRLMRERGDCRVSTLSKIVQEGLGRKLVIKVV